MTAPRFLESAPVLRRNLILLCLTLILAVAVVTMTFLGDLLSLLAGTLLVSYLLLDLAGALERLYVRAFPAGCVRRRLPASFARVPLPGINHRFLAVSSSIFSLIALLAVAAHIALPAISQEVGGFVKSLPGYYQALDKQLESLGKAQWGDRVIQRLMSLPQSARSASISTPLRVIVTPPAATAIPPSPVTKTVVVTPLPVSVDATRRPKTNATAEEAAHASEGPQTARTSDAFNAQSAPDLREETPAQESQDPLASTAEIAADAKQADFQQPPEPQAGHAHPVPIGPPAPATPLKTPTRHTPSTTQPVLAPTPVTVTVQTSAAALPAKVTVAPVVSAPSMTIDRSVSSAAPAARPTALNQLLDVFRRFVINPGSFNVMDLLGASLTGLVYTLTGLALLFYFLMDGKRLAEGAFKLTPESVRPQVMDLLTRAHRQFHALVRIQAFTAVITGLLLYSCFTFVLKLPYTGFLSAFFGAAALFPALGPWFGALPSSLVLLFDGRWLSFALTLTGLGGFFLYKQRRIIPKLFGPRSDIHPIVSILTQLACVRLFGAVPGLLTALPLSCLMMAAYRMLCERRRLQNAMAARGLGG